jgi:6,7-dimethyl-8-ribityllumazine synthase
VSSSGGFWPGDNPVSHEVDETSEEDVLAAAEEAARGDGSAAPEPSFSANGDEPVDESEPTAGEAEAIPSVADEDTGDQVAVAEPSTEARPEARPEPQPEPELELRLAGHAPGELRLPDGVHTLEGSPSGTDRAVGVVVSRFNGDVTNRLLESAFEELDRAGVAREHVTVVPVPGAFELPLAAMGLAKTRRYACIVALGCVIRGETAHFDYVAGEAASGLQLAGLETGVPVAFGVLTVDTLEQAMARAGKGAEAVQSALEMADLFGLIRQQARAGS